jgi:hypothetical protein
MAAEKSPSAKNPRTSGGEPAENEFWCGGVAVAVAEGSALLLCVNVCNAGDIDIDEVGLGTGIGIPRPMRTLTC